MALTRVQTGSIQNEAVTTAKIDTTGISAGDVIKVNDAGTGWEFGTIQASELTTEGSVFSNYNTITSDVTTTLSSTKNSFLKGTITVNNGITWTVTGDGELEII